ACEAATRWWHSVSSSRSRSSAYCDQPRREGPVFEPPQRHGGVEQMRAHADGHEPGAPYEARPRGDREVAHDACHAKRHEAELPVSEALTPDGLVQHDRDQLVRRAEDRQRDPAQREGVRQREDMRMIVVARQVTGEPRQRTSRDQERERGYGQEAEWERRGWHARSFGGHRARRWMTMRTTPGSGSSVWWVNPRSSSCGYRNIGRRSWTTVSVSPGPSVSNRSS